MGTPPLDATAPAAAIEPAARAAELIRAVWRGDVENGADALAATDLLLRAGRLPLDSDTAALPHTAVALSRAARAVAQARGGGGTTLPGKLLLDRSPDALRRLAARLRHGVVLVGGTNGKTTTAAMLAAILRHAGLSVAHNRAGANMHWGVASALLEIEADIGVFEVDEAWLPLVAAEVQPRAIVLGNLFRDRPDGYGELDAIARVWTTLVRSELASATTLVLNADDPTIASLRGDERDGPLLRFGVDDPTVALLEDEHAVDASHCRSCGARYRFERRFLSHLGHYRCAACGNGRPTPDVSARRVALDGLSASRVTLAAPSGEVRLELPLPGLFNVYNALAAAAAAFAVGIEGRAVATGLAQMRPVFGRGETLQVEGTELVILLMKNPAGANELLRTFAGAGRTDLWIALNDRMPDGRDISWIWDVDFEQAASAAGTVTCTGRRAAELALRLKYAGWEAVSVDESVESSLDHALAHARGRLVALPTYSAMLELRTLLTRRGLAAPYWA